MLPAINHPSTLADVPRHHVQSVAHDLVPAVDGMHLPPARECHPGADRL
jgi:hypothetical protein